MTAEEAKIEQAIRAARIAKQTLLEETRNSMPLEVDEELVKVKRPKAENVTIKVPNQDKEGFGLAGVEEEYKIKKSFTPEEKRKLGADLAALLEKDPEEALREMETKIIARMRESVGRNKFKKAVDPKEDITLRTQLSTITGLNVNIGLELLEGEKARLTKKQIETISRTLKEIKAMKTSELQTRIALIEGLGLTNVIRVLK